MTKISFEYSIMVAILTGPVIQLHTSDAYVPRTF